MKHLTSGFSPQCRVLLRFVQMIALIGLIYSLVSLAGNSAPNADAAPRSGWLFLYTSWFALAVVSVEAIFYRIKAGVVTLVCATVVVTVAELIGGVASIGGASLGLLVAFIVIVYIRPMWGTFD